MRRQLTKAPELPTAVCQVESSPISSSYRFQNHRIEAFEQLLQQTGVAFVLALLAIFGFELWLKNHDHLLILFTILSSTGALLIQLQTTGSGLTGLPVAAKQMNRTFPFSRHTALTALAWSSISGFAFYDNWFGCDLCLIAIGGEIVLIIAVLNSLEHWKLRDESKGKISSSPIKRSRQIKINKRGITNLTPSQEEDNYITSTLTTQYKFHLRFLDSLPGMGYRAINNGQWSLIFLSNGCQDLLGQSRDELIGNGKDSLNRLLDSEERIQLMDDFINTQKTQSFKLEYTMQTHNGNELRVVENGCGVFNQQGKLLAIEGFVSAINPKPGIATGIAQFQNYDGLTGTLNRIGFENIVQETMSDSSPHFTAHAMLCLDVDQFKIINDTCGYIVGDNLLKQVACELKNCLPACGTLARMDSNEFGIFLQDCDAGDAQQVAEKLSKTIEAFEFQSKDRVFRLTVSIGIAIGRADQTEFKNLFSAAAVASYTAKEKGGNRIHCNDENDNYLKQFRQEIYWAKEIPAAIAEDRLFLERQMIVPVGHSDSNEKWYEVLLRLRTAEGEVINPGEFIPAVERYNLSVAMDIWVLKTLLSKLSDDQLPDADLYFVNISGHSMGQPAFLDAVCELLAKSSVPANQLCFEITETAAVSDLKQGMEMMRTLQSMGCKFAIDDFGSGLSSYSYLKDFPAEFLKIDGDFVADITENSINRSIVTSISDVGHATGMRVIAEYVEDDQTLTQLQRIGVDFAQGYGIHRPDLFPCDHKRSKDSLKVL